MKNAKFWIARRLLWLVRWYFVGREVTCVRYDYHGIPEYVRGKITGGRIDFERGDVSLSWVQDNSSFFELIEVPARDLYVVNDGWQFRD